MTVTVNPAIDVSTSVGTIAPFTKLRCAAPHKDPGGGGINVARVVHRLGGDVVAIYPDGGASGRLLRALVDREGVRIVIAARSVYEFHLNRVLKHAKLTNAPSTHAAFELFAKQKLDALVGLRPRLAVDAQMMPGSRIVDGRFMVVEQAICTPKQRDLILKIVDDNRLDKNEVEQLAQDRFGKGVKLLQGFRGMAAVDMDKLAQVISDVSRACCCLVKSLENRSRAA